MDLRAAAGLAFSIPLLLSCGSSSGERQPPAGTGAGIATPAKIVMFYPNQAVVARGQEVTLCYGVEGATSVRLDPPIAAISPSINRCIAYKPARTTEVKLFANGSDGKEVAQSLTIHVEGEAEAGGMIATFMAMPDRVPRGGRTSICFKLLGAAKADIAPAIGQVPVDRAQCVVQTLEQTTVYTLTAEGQGGRQSRKLTVRVE